jgi:hypothetical protein
LGRDEYRVLEWIGLPLLRDGDQQWVDLAARVVDQMSITPTSPEMVWAPAWEV